MCATRNCTRCRCAVTKSPRTSSLPSPAFDLVAVGLLAIRSRLGDTDNRIEEGKIPFPVAAADMNHNGVAIHEPRAAGGTYFWSHKSF